MDIYLPGPIGDYENENLFYDELAQYRRDAAEAIGVSLDELHELGPETVQQMLTDAGHTIIRATGTQYS